LSGVFFFLFFFGLSSFANAAPRATWAGSNKSLSTSNTASWTNEMPRMVVSGVDVVDMQSPSGRHAVACFETDSLHCDGRDDLVTSERVATRLTTPNATVRDHIIVKKRVVIGTKRAPKQCMLFQRNLLIQTANVVIIKYVRNFTVSLFGSLGD
jgi:hypothetical protein